MTTTTASKSDALADLARTWGNRNNAQRTERLLSLVHPSWQSVPEVALTNAWEDFMDAVLRLEDLNLDWHDYPDTCACQIDVELLVGGWVDEALKKLTDGPRRGAEGTGN
jgi:hypothetical protein